MAARLVRTISQREFSLGEFALETALGEAGKRGVISLGPGDPDFRPPKYVLDAAKRALDAGKTHYGPDRGVPELREAILKKATKENRIRAGLENVLVHCGGASEAIVNVAMATLDPGEHMMVVDPSYESYKPVIELVNGVSVPVRVTMEDDFFPNADIIRKSVIEPKKTIGIIINTPNNPTGAVYPKKVLEEIADVAVENDWLVISDEAYEHFVYSGRHVSMASLNGMADRTLTLFTFSKTFALTGFRIGYSIGPEKVIKAMTKIHLFNTIAAPMPLQYGCVEALKRPRAFFKKVLAEYDRRRLFIHRRLNEIEGVYCPEPRGAFYVFPKYDFGVRSADLAKKILEQGKVVCIPGSEYGLAGEGHLRFSYTTSMANIRKAMDRVERVVRGLPR
ncbi:MAG: pyridoxal phosphate-dependent aminotransferase [Candidatus Aenigmatarchaeota archaeon]